MYNSDKWLYRTNAHILQFNVCILNTGLKFAFMNILPISLFTKIFTDILQKGIQTEFKPPSISYLNKYIKHKDVFWGINQST